MFKVADGQNEQKGKKHFHMVKEKILVALLTQCDKLRNLQSQRCVQKNKEKVCLHADEINRRKQSGMERRANTDSESKSEQISKIIPVDAAIYVEK